MKFVYTATTENGTRVRAIMQAASRQEALSALKEKKLTVTSLSHMESGRQIYIGGVTNVQKVVFTKHLAVMLRAGIALDEALQTLAAQSVGRLGETVETVRKDIESGMRLADAMGKHPKVFNQYYTSMIRAGEESGTLTDNLEQLSNRYEKDYELRQKVRGALMYPAIVLSLTIGLMMAIALFVLPKLTLLFKSAQYQLPWYTKFMLVSAQFLAQYGLISAIGFIAACVVLVWITRRPFAAPVVHRIYLHVPIVGGIVRTVNLARFSIICGSLLKSGVPITKATTITANVLGNVIFRDTLLRAVPRISTGEPLSSVLEESALFPPFSTRMLVAGEQTGKLSDMLLYLADFYEHELDGTLKNLSTLLEPALLIFIGLIVLSLALSIITPIYSFIGSLT